MLQGIKRALFIAACCIATVQAVFPQQPLGHSQQGHYEHGAVATDTPICSEIGADILRKGGSVVDAAVAAMFCNGVLDQPHTGLGGGTVMTIYERPRDGGPRELVSINGDIRVPQWITDPSVVNWDGTANTTKYEKIAVPGEVAGYWWAWKRYGRLPWTQLVIPSINLARKGFKVRHMMTKIMEMDWPKVQDEPGLEFFRRYDSEGNPQQIPEGSIIIDKALAESLELIAEEGAETFYTGKLSHRVLQDLQDYDSKITADDLANYQVRISETTSTKLGDGDKFIFHSAGFPSYGSVTSFILRVLTEYNMTTEQLSTPQGMALFYHRFVEINRYLTPLSRCFGEGIRETPGCGDMEYELLEGTNLLEAVINAVDDTKIASIDHYTTTLSNSMFAQPQDSGTSHFSVISRDGSALSATNTIAFVYGVGVKGNRTGIVFNNRLSSFNHDPSIKTAIDLKQGATGYTRRTPTLVMDKAGRVILSIGSSGGSRITAGIVKAMYLHLFHGVSLQTAIDYPVVAEGGISQRFMYVTDPLHQAVVNELSTKGQHFTPFDETDFPSLYTAVTQGISMLDCYSHPVPRDPRCIEAVSDFRKAGRPDGF